MTFLENGCDSTGDEAFYSYWDGRNSRKAVAPFSALLTLPTITRSYFLQGTNQKQSQPMSTSLSLWKSGTTPLANTLEGL